MRIGRLTIERRTDAEAAERCREAAANVRRQLGKRGESVARRYEKEAEKLERGK